MQEEAQIIAELLAHPFYAARIQRKGSRPERPAFVVTPQGCLAYDGSLNKKGYGRRGAGKTVHREAWEQLVGPIPSGYEVHHICERKDCARIDHLMCLSKAAHALLEGRPLKLKADDVEEILRLIVAGVPHAQIAEQFGVVRPYISLIKYGQRWASVVRPFWRKKGIWPEGERRDVRLAA
jgi:hypothetical protein